MVLTRDIFRQQVFERDGSCVICNGPAEDAHHIMERKLWDDGGYHLDNGAALCSGCHFKAETTLIHIDEIRRAAGMAARRKRRRWWREEEEDENLGVEIRTYEE